MIHSFAHTFLTGILPLLLIWTALALLVVAAVQLLRGLAPRVPLATGAAAAAIFTAGALVTQLA